MKHKWLIITFSVLFFLTALTFYVNRIIFPTVIRKIAIEQAQNFLKRKVEIESLRFNWLKGVVVNNIKIYQKDSQTEVLAQAEKISASFIFVPWPVKHESVPNFKQFKLIFPSIKIESPSFHLIYKENNEWNISDLLTPTQSTTPSTEKPSPFAVQMVGIKINNGKLRLDDTRPGKTWYELFDQINIDTQLIFNGIKVYGNINIPKKQGYITLTGNYHPIHKTLTTELSLENIKPSDYLDLFPLQLPLIITDGTINKMKLHIDYNPTKTAITGDWSIKDLDLTYAENHIKSTMEVSKSSILLGKKSNSIKGSYSLKNTQIHTPFFSLEGTLKTTIDDFKISSDEENSVKFSLQSENLKLQLPNKQTFQGQIKTNISQGRWKNDSAVLEGAMEINNASLILNDLQSIQGHTIKFNNITLNKANHLIQARSDLNLKDFNILFPGQIIKGNLESKNLVFELDDQLNLKINGPINLKDFDIQTNQIKAKGSLHLKDFTSNYYPKEQILETNTRGNIENTSIDLAKQGQFNGTINLDMQLNLPFKKLSALDYKIKLDTDGANFKGLPIGTLNNIHLKANIKTDLATIEDLSMMVLETPIKASGSISHFSKPEITIAANSEHIDLSKLKDVAPELLKTYGLSINGETSFQLKFEGLATDPLNGKINAQAILRNVNVESSTLKQNIKNVSGTLKADGDSLSWEDFTATLMDKTATLSGRLTNFKNPRIKTTLSSEGLELKAEINKDNTMVNIKNISGQYLSVLFQLNGSVDLSSKTPQMDLTSNLNFKLEDASTLAPQLKETLNPLKLSGPINITTSLKGPASNWKNWTLNATAKSDLITIAGFKFDHFNIDLNQNEGVLKKFNIASGFYAGTLNILTTANLNDAAMPFETALRLENADLAKLKNDTGSKDEDLRGFIGTTAVVKGNFQHIMDIEGNGSFSIMQGYLMKKEFSSLFLIPELSHLTFTEATANFAIANQKITTENLALKSEGAILNGTGWVGFDHKLDLTLNPEFNTETIVQSESLKKGTTALFATAIGKYLTIHIDGTLEKPQIHTIKKPTEIIKRTGEIITDNVGQILQGIFQ